MRLSYSEAVFSAGHLIYFRLRVDMQKSGDDDQSSSTLVNILSMICDEVKYVFDLSHSKDFK